MTSPRIASSRNRLAALLAGVCLALAGGWLAAEPAVVPGPDIQLQRAIELLQRHQAQVAREIAAREIAEESSARAFGGEPLQAETLSATPTVAGPAPGLGSASLSLDGDVHFGSDPVVFKDGELFLHTDTAVTANLALGYRALANDSAGASNTALGSTALTSNVYGKRNTAVGFAAMRDNTQGDYNTALGAYSLRENEIGSYNTAAGESALKFNTSGSRNTAIGRNALYSNTSGNDNTAVGSIALFASTGDGNTAIGYRALDDNTSGKENVALGFRALYQSVDGDRSVALGRRALYSHAGGGAIRNTAAGRDALRQLTSGSVNAALGHQAGDALTSGSGNIFIGSSVNGAATESDTIRIGGGTGSGLNQQDTAFIAGIRGTTTDVADAIAVLIDSAGQMGTMNSSRALKQDISPIGEFSERLRDLDPVAFRYREHAARDSDSAFQYGLIAEDVAEVFPELVVHDARDQPQTIKYHLLEPLLLDRLQVLARRLGRQREILERQQHEVETARRRLAPRGDIKGDTQ